MNRQAVKNAQLHFNLQTRVLLGREDFFVAPCNTEAVRLVDSLPEMNAGALIYGGAGSGKTHLAHLFAESILKKTGEETVFVNADALTLDASERILNGARFAVLENAGAGIGEEYLFHLLNAARNAKGCVLITARLPYREWNLRLPDLISRLSALPSAAVGLPDDNAMRYVLLKMFSDRQLRVPFDVIEYLLKHIERSFAGAQKAVEAADELSLTEGRNITVSLLSRLFR